MNTLLLDPRKALNKAYLKIKPSRSFIETFKTNLISVLDSINHNESEEHHKNIMMDFFKKTYYDPGYYINTKGRTDWVIHNGKDSKSSVGVIIETKSPKNAAEMITVNNLNKKALHELVLYYMRERIIHKNLDVRYLIITNVYEWFIFDAQHFDKLFAQNKEFVRQFKESEESKSSDSSTRAFYREIAEPFIAALPATLEFTHFDIRNYNKILRNADKEDDKQLIALYKLLAPPHLLKLSFLNDSNSLDKNFYSELLHIIGLTETKEAGKKLIQRNKVGQRHSGSLLENAIVQLDSMDKLSRLQNPLQYGATVDERLFTVALELTLTWVNRILFLKLLEAQLISYQKGNLAYSFLNLSKIRDYDNLNTLFFQVLAKQVDERNPDIQRLFEKVPYLNSSLFEMTDLEHNMFPISQLEDNKTLPLLASTVIKDTNGRKVSGEMNALHYFFSFLDAYDFASEGSEDIQEDNKTLINASVLGLIFEKINGYKDGSFFTPGFITMYMCREAIRKSVIQKFNEVKGWDCKTFIDLQNQKYEIAEANNIINSLKICDPAVGSGHFLVSALNEIISIKSRMEILCDREGRLLRHYQIIIENDELMVFDDRDGSFFQYNPISEESRRVQETLFNEKQTIIENCLFGVDINTNSVKICRLRLWIELLKNAYYKGPDFKQLETLPNIDINIKSGNSLISRFPLDADLTKALKESKWNIESYKLAVSTYRDAESKQQKQEMERLINTIKGNFRSEISAKDPKKLKLEKSKGQLLTLTTQTGLFERSKKEEAAWNKSVKSTVLEINKLEKEIEEIKSNKMFENAFEWRFEFPEVLDNDGNYKGFDVIIGNPPYIQLQKMGQGSTDLEKMNYTTFNRTGDIYSLFYELAFRLLKPHGFLSFITSNKWMRAAYGESLRRFFVEQTNPLTLIDFGGIQVFDTATVDTNILIAEKALYQGTTNACVLDKNFSINNTSDYLSQRFTSSSFNSSSWIVLSPIEQQIRQKIEKIGKPLKDWDTKIYRGILTGYNEAFIINQETRDKLVAASPKNDEIIRPILLGKNVKRYRYSWENLWIIFTRRGVDIDHYPAVKEHLLRYYEKLKPRNNNEPIGRKPGFYEWFHIQDNVAYFRDFEKPKIVWGNLALHSQFSFVDSGYYINAPSAFIATDNNYLLAILNSKVADYYIKQLGVTRNGGYFEYKPMFVEQMPIPVIGELEQREFCNVVKEIVYGKSNNLDTSGLELQIDDMIFELYNLNQEEIELITNS